LPSHVFQIVPDTFGAAGCAGCGRLMVAVSSTRMSRLAKASKQVARTADFAVRVFSIAIIATVPYSIAVSELRRPFPSAFFIAVRLLRRREELTEPDFALLAQAFNRVVMGRRPTHRHENRAPRHPRESGNPALSGLTWTPAYAGVTRTAGWRRRCFLTSAICRRHVSPRVETKCPGHLPGPFGKSQTPNYGVCASPPSPQGRGLQLLPGAHSEPQEHVGAHTWRTMYPPPV
jgi:hypothetical protein